MAVNNIPHRLFPEHPCSQLFNHLRIAPHCCAPPRYMFPLYFHALTNCPFSKLFVFISIRIAGGYPHSSRFWSPLSPLITRRSPLSFRAKSRFLHGGLRLGILHKRIRHEAAAV